MIGMKADWQTFLRFDILPLVNKALKALGIPARYNDCNGRFLLAVSNCIVIGI